MNKKNKLNKKFIILVILLILLIIGSLTIPFILFKFTDRRLLRSSYTLTKAQKNIDAQTNKEYIENAILNTVNANYSVSGTYVKKEESLITGVSSDINYIINDLIKRQIVFHEIDNILSILNDTSNVKSETYKYEVNGSDLVNVSITIGDPAYSLQAIFITYENKTKKVINMRLSHFFVTTITTESQMISGSHKEELIQNLKEYLGINFTNFQWRIEFSENDLTIFCMPN